MHHTNQVPQAYIVIIIYIHTYFTHTHMHRQSIPEMDWAACLPSRLRKLVLSGLCTHHALLQHLVQMTHLKEVHVGGLSEGPNEQRKVLSEGCTWEHLTVETIASFHDLSQFSHWPEGVNFPCTSSL